MSLLNATYDTKRESNNNINKPKQILCHRLKFHHVMGSFSDTAEQKCTIIVKTLSRENMWPAGRLIQTIVLTHTQPTGRQNKNAQQSQLHTVKHYRNLYLVSTIYKQFIYKCIKLLILEISIIFLLVYSFTLTKEHQCIICRRSHQTLFSLIV